MLDFLLDYIGEITLAVFFIFYNLVFKKKTPEEVKKQLEKKRVQYLEKASKQTVKADKYVEKAEKIEV